MHRYVNQIVGRNTHSKKPTLKITLFTMTKKPTTLRINTTKRNMFVSGAQKQNGGIKKYWYIVGC